MKSYALRAAWVVAALVTACSDADRTTRPVDAGAIVATPGEQWGFDAANTFALRVHPTVQMAEAASAPGPYAGPPILYHANGRIIPLPKAAAIYWSNSVVYAGGPTPGTAGPGSADGSVIGEFLRSLGRSSYWSINNEYTDNVGGAHKVANSLTYTRYYANNVAAPGPGANVSDASIRTMLASIVGSAGLPFDQQTIYTVFSGAGVNLGGGFGTQYCAYHGYFARPGHPGQWILYAVLPRAADFVGSCTAVNTPASGSPNEFSADAVINLLATQLDRGVTDPGLNAWFDASGIENAGKCPWLFAPTYTVSNGSSANVRLGSRDYLIQQNWRIGPDQSNQIGCTLAGNMPMISLSPTTLAFNAIQNQPAPSSQASTITNGGGGTLTGLTVGTIAYGPGASGWLQAPVLSSPKANPSATLTAQPNTTTLAPGTYTATIPVLSSAAGNSPQIVMVTYTVDPSVATVTVSPTPVTMAVGSTQQETATLHDANGNVLNRPVSWSSSDVSIATVSSTGLVTAVAAGGPATITATSEGVQGTASITVSSGVVTSVTVSPASGSLRGSTPGFGWTQQLTVTVNGSPGVSQAVTYASGNASIASVSATGLVTAGAAGQTQVTATSVVDPTKSGTYDVTVINGCTNIMPVPPGYVMPMTFLCSSGKDTYSYTAPTDTWVQVEALMTAVNGCSAFYTPFEYVVGPLTTSRAYSVPCTVTWPTYAYVRAGQNRFNIQKGTLPFAHTYIYLNARVITLGAFPACTAFSSDYGVTFSVDVTVSCTSQLALLAPRAGTLSLSASSATMAVTIDLINNSTGSVVATATSGGPGQIASIAWGATTLSDGFNVRVKPAVGGTVGTISVTVSP